VNFAGISESPDDETEAGAMSKREIIVRELEHIPEQDLDKLLVFLQMLRETHIEAGLPAIAAESALAKDWLTPEEDSAWGDL
jgi:hypothetical protein